MITTTMILDLLKEQLGSDYKTAKAFNVTTQRISYIRTKGGVLTDAQGLLAAEILEFPQEAIILSLAAERALNSPAFGILNKIASKYDPRKTAAALFIAAIVSFSYIAPISQSMIV